MTNPLRGEVPLVVGDTTYTLRLSISELIKVETLLDIGVEQIARLLEPQNIRLGNVQAMLWASLQNKHPGTTLDDAAEIMSEIGIPASIAKVAEALQASFPEAAKEGEERPSRAARRKAGTGKVSS